MSAKTLEIKRVSGCNETVLNYRYRVKIFKGEFLVKDFMVVQIKSHNKG